MKAVVFSENRNDKVWAEDAFPVVSDNLIAVADGLGSGIKHTDTLKGMSGFDAFFETAFDGILAFTEDNRSLARENFGSISPETRKYSSAKFASAVTTLSVYDLFQTHQEGAGENKILSFLEYPETKDDPDILERTCSYGEYLARHISKNLKQFKDNLQLIDEHPQMVSDKNQFLPTTLAAAVYIEKEFYVDALIFWVGDSRIYCLNKQGLIPLTEDEEEHNGGGLTNIIQVLRDFHVRCDYRRFEKPVALLAMTDGVFDKKNYGRFDTQERVLIPMEFEKEILERFMDAETMEEFAAKAGEYYADHVIGDDSASMAVKAFGFNGYDAFKEICKKRAVELNHMLDMLPDGFDPEPWDMMQEDFDQHYNTLIEAAKSTLEPWISDYLESIINSVEKQESVPGEAAVCVKEIEKDKSVVENELQEKFERISRQVQEMRQSLNHELIKRWLHVRDVFVTEKKPRRLALFDEDKRFKSVHENRAKTLQLHQETVEKYLWTLKEMEEKLTKQLNSIYALEASRQSYQSCKNEIRNLCNFVEDAYHGRNKHIKAIRKQDIMMDRISAKAWRRDQGNRLDSVVRFLEGEFSIIADDDSHASYLKEMSRKLAGLYEDLEQAQQDRSNIRVTLKHRMMEKYADIIAAHWLEHQGSPMTPQQCALKETFEALKEKSCEFESKYRKQHDIYMAYSRTYCMYYKGDLYD